MREIYKIEMLEDGTVQIGAPSAGEMFSFVHVSDSHLRVPRADLPWTGELADAMLEVVDRTNAAAPDLVVFTGDMLDSFAPDNIAYIKGIFERFDAPVHCQSPNSGILFLGSCLSTQSTRIQSDRRLRQRIGGSRVCRTLMKARPCRDASVSPPRGWWRRGA